MKVKSDHRSKFSNLSNWKTYNCSTCPLSCETYLIWRNLRTQDISKQEIMMYKTKDVGADHAYERHQAVEKSIQEGDFLLLEKRKEKKIAAILWERAIRGDGTSQGSDPVNPMMPMPPVIVTSVALRSTSEVMAIAKIGITYTQFLQEEKIFPLMPRSEWLGQLSLKYVQILVENWVKNLEQNFPELHLANIW